MMVMVNGWHVAIDGFIYVFSFILKEIFEIPTNSLFKEKTLLLFNEFNALALLIVLVRAYLKYLKRKWRKSW